MHVRTLGGLIPDTRRRGARATEEIQHYTFTILRVHLTISRTIFRYLTYCLPIDLIKLETYNHSPLRARRIWLLESPNCTRKLLPKVIQWTSGQEIADANVQLTE